MADSRASAELDTSITKGRGQSGLIRLGGLAMLVGLGIHIVLNAVLKQFPPDNPSLEELQTYLTEQAGTWSIVHGFRYLAFACIVVFAAALFARTALTRPSPSIGWSVVGLLGAAIFVTNGIITNGIELLAFVNDDLISKQPDLFQLLFRMTRVMFTAEVVTWSFLILGFSAAGWSTKTLPKWLSVLGFINVLAGLLAGCFIVSIVTDGWASIIMEVASLSGLLWFACAAVFMLIRGES